MGTNVSKYSICVHPNVNERSEESLEIPKKESEDTNTQKLRSYAILRNQSEDLLSKVTLCFVFFFPKAKALLKLEDGKFFELIEDEEKREIPELQNKDVKSISNTYDSVYLVSSEGALYYRGSLCDGSDSRTDQFTHVPWNLEKMQKVRCGEDHILLLTTDNKVYGWGCNGSGQVKEDKENVQIEGHSEGEVEGGDEMECCIVREPELIMSDVKDVDVGQYFSLVLTNEGAAYVSGLLTNDLSFPSKSKVFIKEPITSICCGVAHAVFLTQSGSVYTMGSNHTGQCGAGDIEVVNEPKQVCKVKAVQIFVGHFSVYSSCIDSNGKIVVWGLCRNIDKDSENRTVQTAEEVNCSQCESRCIDLITAMGRHCGDDLNMKEPLRKSDKSSKH